MACEWALTQKRKTMYISRNSYDLNAQILLNLCMYNPPIWMDVVCYKPDKLLLKSCYIQNMLRGRRMHVVAYVAHSLGPRLDEPYLVEDVPRRVPLPPMHMCRVAKMQGAVAIVGASDGGPRGTWSVVKDVVCFLMPFRSTVIVVSRTSTMHQNHRTSSTLVGGGALKSAMSG